MKSVIFATLMIFFGFSAFSQVIENSSIKGEINQIPSNINVTPEDISILGISFVRQELVTEVFFEVTDVVLNFSHTNNYLIQYNKESDMIEFGCLVPSYTSKEKGVFRLNEKFELPIERRSEAMEMAAEGLSRAE
ncbi:hypothetical protein [Flexithrix dorotheae]|uniref:hypothetical protein n=1 Tax=Flexithrix dorotheae TaxID=70993 RepID=UPI000374823F|nr:hypothetical protein [Flexithrix dorotheae]